MKEYIVCLLVCLFVCLFLFIYLGGDLHLVDRPEQFVASLIGVPLMKNRLESHLFALNFSENYRDAYNPLECLADSNEAVRQCKHLKSICFAVLEIGNMLNEGDPQRGNAQGFKPSTLPKLNELRSTTKPFRTLLQYLCDVNTRISIVFIIFFPAAAADDDDDDAAHVAAAAADDDDDAHAAADDNGAAHAHAAAATHVAAVAAAAAAAAADVDDDSHHSYISLLFINSIFISIYFYLFIFIYICLYLFVYLSLLRLRIIFAFVYIITYRYS